MCPGLAALVVDYLSGHLSPGNVLLVLQHICLYCQAGSPPVTSCPTASHCHTPSAPPKALVDEPPGSPSHGQTEGSPLLGQEAAQDPKAAPGCCDGLLKRCLDLIDEEAKEVLNSEDFEDLDISAVKMIVCRDSLCLKTEAVVLEALLRWSARECKRQKLEVTLANRRTVMEGAQYLVRYLAMTQEELQAATELLTEEEVLALLGALRGNHRGLPEHLSSLTHLMASPRRGRSLPHGLAIHRSRLAGLRRKKRKDKESRAVTQQFEHSLGAARHKEKFNLIEEIFVCLACIFD